MNSCKEFEGKNIDAAIDLACKQLKIKRENIKYDVISTGSSGIFSIIGRKKAKISVIVDNTKNMEKISSLVDEAFGVTQKKKPKRNNKKPQPKQNQQKPNQQKTAKQNQQKQNKSEQPKKQVNKKPVKAKSETSKPDTPKTDKPQNKEVAKDISTEKIISDFYKGKTSEEIGEEVIRKVLTYITSDVDIETETTGEVITFKIVGGESAIIIGKRGQTLEAIQYLVDKIINKHTLERKRVQIDVEGYLEKRRENLEKMAIRMSEKVIRTGKPSTISQMSSQDRRIIHLTLKENKQIRTQSMGEGYYRRLVIFPKKGRKKKNKK